MKNVKRRLALWLALLTLGTLIGSALTGCDSQTVSEVLDLALELADDGSAARDGDGGNELVLNEPDPEEQAPEEQPPEAPAEEEAPAQEENADPAGQQAEENDPPAEPEQEAVPEPEPEPETEAPAPEPEPEPETEAPAPEPEPEPEPEPGPIIDENGSYDDRDNVALYIHTYGKLPPNYISKKEAEKLGWTGGSLERYAPGKCIGGSYFGNYEGLLPKKKGREYHECDIGTLGKSSRGAKRIVYSNDGLIYYTGDHYETFELLYGEE